MIDAPVVVVNVAVVVVVVEQVQQQERASIEYRKAFRKERNSNARKAKYEERFTLCGSMYV
jgi:hypothetical protein